MESYDSRLVLCKSVYGIWTFKVSKILFCPPAPFRELEI